ncbi:Na+/H+ antiporter NhaA [Actinomycetospora sp. NBRC 106378]|uniref:Na+/H+ antiporter NhaA n=1 Tax=Actinomycetospora sp. NBRC 106378 TaxID=3032208 RepID=UPI00331FC3D4
MTPDALRTFLPTLAVVDDLLAITTIYTDDLSVVPLSLALVPPALFASLVQRKVRRRWTAAAGPTRGTTRRTHRCA